MAGNEKKPTMENMEEGGESEDVWNLSPSSGQQGGTQTTARDTLPELVLLKIFDMVPLADLYACYQTCKTFQDLLERRRITFLLPRVLYSLINSGNEEIELNPIEDVLNCRLVSRSWREGVDEYCQNVPLQITDD